MKKITQKCLCLLLCGITLLGMLGIPVRAEEITSVSVTVTEPAVGASPSFTVVTGDSTYQVDTVSWTHNNQQMTESDTFVAGESYTLSLVLRPTSGVFSTDAQCFINGQAPHVKSSSSIQINLSKTFTLASVSQVAVTEVAVPVQDSLPDRDVTVGSNAYYVQEVIWTHLNPPSGSPAVMGSSDRFAGGGQYKLRLVLKPSEGNAFADSVTGTINGASAVCSNVGNGAIALEYTYTVEQLTPITKITLTGMTAPEKDKYPDFSADAAPGALYTVEDVAWRGWNTKEGANTSKNLTASDRFQSGYTYQVAVLLKAKSDAAFQDPSAMSATLNGEQAQLQKLESSANQILLIFTYAVDAEKTPVDQVFITDVVPPSIGKKPSLIAKTPADALYTVDQVVWRRWNMSLSDPMIMGSREVFEENTDYRVDIILKAKDTAAFTVDSFGNPTVRAMVNEKLANSPKPLEDSEAAQYIVVSYSFRTASQLITSISIGALDEPVKGKLPDFKIEVLPNAGYSIEDVIWQWRDPKTPSAKYSKMGFSDIFETDKEYQICVTVRADENAEFATTQSGQPQVTAKFNGDPAKPAAAVEDEDPTKCVQVTFEFLIESDVKTIENVEISEVDLPSPGENPDLDVSVSFVAKYTVNSVVWERLENGSTKKLGAQDTFRAGERYRVTVTLQAKQDGEFSVSTTGRLQVDGTLNQQSAEISVVSGKDPKEYIAVSREFAIYTVIEGDNAKWTPSHGPLTFRFSGNTKDVTGIEIDGIAVKEEFYTVTGSSVAIQLEGDYLSALKDGKHQLAVIYTDGIAATEFEILHDGSQLPTQEGSGSNNSGILILIIALIVVLLCGAIVLSIFLRKKGWL